jgi:hypothetical protein
MSNLPHTLFPERVGVKQEKDTLSLSLLLRSVIYLNTSIRSTQPTSRI